ncbi:MAG: DUF2505 family protein [Deltaproteobacteria bacterium]|nr:DUF2505 family protein [Deltaproteobacteria bacterium]
MAKFEIRHRIDCSAADFWEKIFENQEFDTALYVEALHMDFEMLKWDPETGERSSRIVPNLNAPKAVQKVMGDSQTFVETGTYDKAKGIYTFDVTPSTLKGKLFISGVMHMEPDGDDHCFRVVDFSIEAKIFGVGKIIASVIEKSTKQSYDKSAKFTNEYLAAGRAG